MRADSHFPRRGLASIDLADLQANEPKRSWVPLKKGGGEIHLELTYFALQ